MANPKSVDAAGIAEMVKFYGGVSKMIGSSEGNIVSALVEAGKGVSKMKLQKMVASAGSLPFLMSYASVCTPNMSRILYKGQLGGEQLQAVRTAVIRVPHPANVWAIQ